LKKGDISFFAKSLNSHRRHTNSVTQSTKVLGHFHEVCRAQSLGLEIVIPSSTSLDKVAVYKEQLRQYFGLTAEHMTV